jgi:catechol 2,3-dioxygenase-like lactoylglutathione lyase family enzyme
MFSHVMIGSNDMARSKKFYDALSARWALGRALRTREAAWSGPTTAAGS